MNGLFRPEAVQAARQQWLGPVQLAQPPALRWLALGACTLLAALILLLLGGHYTRKAALAGVLAPDRGLVRLLPTAPATVLERHVQEGQAVHAGDLLFVLAQDRFSRNDATQGRLDTAVAAQQRALEEAARQQRRWAETRARALGLRLQALASEQAALVSELTLHERRLALARQTLERQRTLRRQGFVAEAQLQLREEELLALEAQAQTLRRQQASLAREQAALEGERATLPVERDAALAQVGSQIAEAQRDGADLQGVRRIEIRAPQDGSMHGLGAQVGQAVAPPAALASLLPAGATLRAQLFAPSALLGHVQVGQAVRLRLEAWPHARYGHLDGRIQEVTRVPLTPGDLAALPLPPGATAPGAEPRYRITVALAPLPPAWAGRTLTPGLRLQADVLLERRPLIDWMLSPLRSVQDRL